MKKSALLASGLVLLVCAPPLIAQSRGGGRPGGGGSPGVSTGGRPSGGGTRGWNGGGRGYTGGGRGYNGGGRYYGGGRGYYRGGGYRGWYGGYRGWYGGYWPRWGWGWGWGWAGWYGGPYAWGYPGYYGGYGYGGYGAPYGVSVEAGPGWAAVDTDVSPESARVFLNGQYIGIADDFDGFPDYLYLRRGRYRLEFKLDGYEPRVVDVDARPGMKADVDGKLAKIPGAARYGSYSTPELPGGVQRFYGKAKDGSIQPEMGEEQYEAVPEREGDSQQEPPSEGQPPSDDRPSGSTDTWRDAPDGSPPSAPPQPAPSASPTRLVIRAEPADAAVYLDDRFIGTAEEVSSQTEGLRIPAGRHTITVSRPGYQDRTTEVEVDSGQTETVEIDLER